MSDQLQYLNGFGNGFCSEAVPNTLPKRQNTPQQCPQGLVAELLSGSAFTMPQKENLSTWLYRKRPSAGHPPFQEYEQNTWVEKWVEREANPNQFRWSAPSKPKKKIHFIDSLFSMAVSGSARQRAGMAALLYNCNQSMQDIYFYNADGDFLIVPQEGRLLISTEMGPMQVDPLEIAVIPRGIKYKVDLLDDWARGYVCENFGAPFRIPDKGPIGSHGLANARHFESPKAKAEDGVKKATMLSKFLGRLWKTELNHSPLDVLAWHGNYVPYKYHLENFQVVNSVSFDHNDPSIFTVLTSPSTIPGTANVDFVIFPPRWMVAENTFRPPYYHRNIMSEFMGLITGEYDAKQGGDNGFVPGGSSLHNCYTAHGPDAATFKAASKGTLKPQYLANTMAFMFESRLVLEPSKQALNCEFLQEDYWECWDGF
ncbi:MAG: homogentisate 1,2-dioxygenase [Deltaproteobacteria bacterium]|nr:homogentisate 1,2-dioxygenase [Deltaproteobacteria bacterium]